MSTRERVVHDLYRRRITTMPKLIAFLSLAVIWSASAYAENAHLVSSTPVDGAVSNASPSTFVFEFSKPVQLHGAFIKKDEEKSKLLGSIPQARARNITVPAPLLSPGHYVLDWQAFTDDSHVVSGRIHFVVSNEAAAASASLH
jgi:methionine-rich copper-binding protein CopC